MMALIALIAYLLQRSEQSTRDLKNKTVLYDSASPLHGRAMATFDQPFSPELDNFIVELGVRRDHYGNLVLMRMSVLP